MYPIIIIIFIKCVTVLYIRTKMDFVVGDDYGGGGGFVHHPQFALTWVGCI